MADAAERVDGDAEILVVSPAFFVERLEDAAATICLRSSGARLRIPRALFEALLRFREPTSLQRLVEAVPALARAAPAIDNLRAKGFLVPESEACAPVARRAVTDPPVRMFDCPAHRLAPAEADVVMFGVPWDAGDRAACGARAAPLAIREASLQLLYGVDRFSGRPLGWYDADLGRPVLAGVSIGDCGDVFVDHGEPQAAVHARLTSALDAVHRDDALPVLLGGDATICVPLVERLQARAPLTVVRIGGPVQRVDAPDDRHVDARGLARRFSSMPGVVRTVQIEPRHDGDAPSPAGLRVVGLDALRTHGFDAVREHLAPGGAVHVGLDIGALQVPGDGDDACGLGYVETRDLLLAIGRHARIVGFDLVGLVPGAPCWDARAMTSLHLLIAGLSAAKDDHATQ